MKKKLHQNDPLATLVEAADFATLSALVFRLAATGAETRRTCLEFLKKHVAMTKEMACRTEAEVAFSLWDELEFDLSELDEYGGGDYTAQDHVGELLYDLQKSLAKTKLGEEDRRALLDRVMPYIDSRNSGMEDALYDVAYAACKKEEDWRDLAQRLEALGQDWPRDHARRIYRRLGDGRKFLELRQGKMETGTDFHDLATFYWETGEQEKALAVARRGLTLARGRMDELREFMAERAQESGDRQSYLELQFEQAADHLTLKKYKAFKKECSATEWTSFEPRMLHALGKTWKDDQLEIRMHRKEFKQVLALLAKTRYPDCRGYEGTRALEVATRLEKDYPQEILAFYLSGLGNSNVNNPRKVYAHQADVAKKVRHMWVDILQTPEKWTNFAKKLKADNARKPAFQQEFGNIVPGWRQL